MTRIRSVFACNRRTASSGQKSISRCRRFVPIRRMTSMAITRPRSRRWRKTLAAPKTFPTLTGVSDVTVADWDGDGTPEIFLLSQDERQIGVTRFDKNGRIAFPTILPLDGKPLAMAVGSLDAKGKPVLFTIL